MMKTTSNLAIAVEFSENKKLSKGGTCSTTYACKASCPKTCPLMKTGGCYGQSGPIGWQWQRISIRNPETRKTGTAREIALAEAAAIRRLSGLMDLRIHSLGDCQTDEAAKIVSKAGEEHMAKEGRRAWSYTHAWKTVKRSSWGKVACLASCERPKDVKLAQARGYATALVVLDFPNGAKPFMLEGVKVLPCLKMVGVKDSCFKCGLCMNDAKLRKSGITIGFKVHGPHIRAEKALAKANCAK